jgi:hypothetical protein
VLENNLTGAIQRADDHSMKSLQAIVNYLYWEIQGNCWGSPEKVEKWRRAKAQELAESTRCAVVEDE